MDRRESEVAMHTMDVHTPILVGASAVTQKVDDPLSGDDAIGLMERAAREALEDTGAPGLLDLVGEISVPTGTWSYPNAAGVLAERLGSSAATLRSELGVLQSSVIHRAINRVEAGEIAAALLVGGEAKYRELQALIAGVELDDLVEVVGEPDTVIPPDVLVIDRLEIDAGLVQAVQHYAFLEHAIRAHDGTSIEDHRVEVAELVAGFNKVAQGNPLAWNRSPMAAEFIAEFSAKNKPLALPYAKWHNSQWNVDQASALFVTTVGHAQRLGISREKWIFPRGGADSNHVVPILRRAELHRCPGAGVTAAKALELAGVDHVDYHELYSCFPSAVRIQAREIGLDTTEAPSITGGMAYGGGPFNNFVLQATAQMAHALRSDPGATAMISAVSGMLTKQGFTIWSTEAGDGGWGYAETSDAVAAVTGVVDVAPGAEGPAVVVSYTVLYDGLEPVKGVAIVDTAGGRTIVATNDDEIVASMTREEWCGRSIAIGEKFT
jgi:acetyl-CoA C-acetyltransferase